jgi:dolichol kinase
VPVEKESAETARKAVHIGALVFPATLLVFPAPYGTGLLGLAAAGAILVEGGRFLSPTFNRFFTGRFGPLLRSGESRGVTGATWLLVAGCLILIFLPVQRCSLILSQHIVGDAAAALAGRRWGRHRLGNKSLEGSLAYLLAAWMVLLFYCWKIIVPPHPGIIFTLGIFFTAVELFSSRGRDNIFVPVLGGVAYKLFW